jgi:serine/threonine-protein kinase
LSILFGSTSRRQRFIQEAQAASALNHPNIITVNDIPEIDGELVLVMQYIEGRTLREILARGPLPLPEALRAAVQIADALALAHSRGILHRGGHLVGDRSQPRARWTAAQGRALHQRSRT